MKVKILVAVGQTPENVLLPGMIDDIDETTARRWIAGKLAEPCQEILAEDDGPWEYESQ